jgi:hypothetical protein
MIQSDIYLGKNSKPNLSYKQKAEWWGLRNIYTFLYPYQEVEETEKGQEKIN